MTRCRPTLRGAWFLVLAAGLLAALPLASALHASHCHHAADACATCQALAQCASFVILPPPGLPAFAARPCAAAPLPAGLRADDALPVLPFSRAPPAA